MTRTIPIAVTILLVMSIIAVLLFTLVVVRGPGGGSGTAGQPGAAQPEAAPAPEAPSGLRLVSVDTLPGVDDPFDDRWDEAESYRVQLQRQNMATPMLETQTLESADIQAMTDGRRMAWRISWEAAEPSYMLDTGRFSDAVAIQFPLADGAPPIMGSDDRPVHILYWQARWQRDIDDAYQDVHHVHPNFWSDAYWFAEGEFPYPIEESFQSEEARQWLVAHAANNPMAMLDRAQPVQELVAAGFGTLTAQDQLLASAGGEWRNGRWAVVIERPIDGDDELSQRLINGDADELALAVWDGSAGNVGGRKHWTMWVPIVRQ